MNEKFLACPLFGGILKPGKRIPPKDTLLQGIMGLNFFCIICKKEVIPIEFSTEKQYNDFLDELNS